MDGDPQAVSEELLALGLTGWVRGGDTGPRGAWPCVAEPLRSGLCSTSVHCAGL